MMYLLLYLTVSSTLFTGLNEASVSTTDGIVRIANTFFIDIKSKDSSASFTIKVDNNDASITIKSASFVRCHTDQICVFQAKEVNATEICNYFEQVSGLNQFLSMKISNYIELNQTTCSVADRIQNIFIENNGQTPQFISRIVNMTGVSVSNQIECPAGKINSVSYCFMQYWQIKTMYGNGNLIYIRLDDNTKIKAHLFYFAIVESKGNSELLKIDNALSHLNYVSFLRNEGTNLLYVGDKSKCIIENSFTTSNDNNGYLNITTSAVDTHTIYVGFLRHWLCLPGAPYHLTPTPARTMPPSCNDITAKQPVSFMKKVVHPASFIENLVFFNVYRPLS